MDASLIVPTHNRWPRLRQTLEALCRQTHAFERFEVIVVANGCTDVTAVAIRALTTPYPLRLLEVPAPGLSRARNAGAARAAAAVLIFLDDDVAPRPELVAAHVHAHADAADDVVAIGRLLAPPDVPRALMHERFRRQQAAFVALQAQQRDQLDWFCVTGGNMSVRKPLFDLVGGFDTELVGYGGEDYELGYRLQQAGARFVFAAAAGGYHERDPATSLSDHLQRARAVGRNDVAITRRHPQTLPRLPIGLALRPHSALGRVGRVLAFDHAQLGDVFAHMLSGGAAALARPA